MRRRALALAGVIADAQRNGSWRAMQPRHQQLTLAMLRWYEAGAPMGREPSAEVPIEEWLSPQQLLPPQPSQQLAASRPYGVQHTCALSVETLEDRYRQELERADRYGTPLERVFARGRARDRLHDRYQLRRTIRASIAARGADPEPVSTAVQPGSITLMGGHHYPRSAYWCSLRTDSRRLMMRSLTSAASAPPSPLPPSSDASAESSSAAFACGAAQPRS